MINIISEWVSFFLTIIFGMLLGAIMMYVVMEKYGLERKDITEFIFEDEDEELRIIQALYSLRKETE